MTLKNTDDRSAATPLAARVGLTVEAALSARRAEPPTTLQADAATPAEAAAQAPAQPAAATARRPSQGLGLWLLLLLATLLVPALGGLTWHLHQMRTLAMEDAFAQADLIAVGTTERLQWLMQDAQAMMARIAARPQVQAMDPARCDQLFFDFPAISPTFKALSLRRSDAMSICSDQRQPPSQASVAASPWFQGAIRHPSFHASGVHMGQVQQTWTARLTYPVRGDAGSPVGLLVTPVDLQQLRQRLFARLPATAVAAVVDGSNRVLVRSQRQDERVGKPAAEGVARVLDVLRAERLRSGGPDRSTSRRFVEVGISGQRNLFVVRTVPMTDWTVVAALPEDDTLQAYYASRNRSLAAIVMMLVLAGVAAWRVGRSILVPIQGLAAATRGLAAGATAQPVPVSGPREIQTVAREFNRMAAATSEATTQLRASESHYRTLLQHLPVAVVSHRPDSSVEVANDRACELLQMTAAQMSGKLASDRAWHFVDSRGQRLQPEAYPISRVLRTSAPLPPEPLGIVFHALGDAAPAPEAQTWVLVAGYPQFDAQGALARVIVVFVDVTAQHAAEQLRVAKEAAETASQAKSDFLSRVSHELRTPLNAINGFSELLLGDARLPADAQARIGHVHRAGQHLLALINQVLDLTRIESGPRQAAMQPLALWPLVEDCMAICTPLAQAKGVSLLSAAPLPGAAPDAAQRGQAWVCADATRLRQVLINLLSNGIKYNRPQGTVTVSLQPAVVAAGQPELLLHIADTGIGLVSSQIAGLFQPFNRLGAEHSGIEGHGLGLSIARSLMQSMGGDISVRAEPGGGSCFTLHLHSAAPAGAAAEQPADAPAARAAPSMPGRRVLYIEDNELNMLLMRQIVGRRPALEFHEATDGEAGVLAALALQPDLVLVDIGLPLLDGFGVLQRLRADPRTARIPCWAVTADNTPETAARAHACGFQRFMTKPVKVAAMLDALDDWAREPPNA